MKTTIEILDALAAEAVQALVRLPNMRMLHETAGHIGELERLLSRGDVTGPRLHDARVAAICLTHGVSELWTADRDFSRLPALRTVNPLARGA